MRVAFMHFYTLRLRRGIETVVLNLSNALALKGVDVTLLTGRRLFSLPIPPASNLRIHEFPALRYFAATWIVPFYAVALLRDRYEILNIFFADFGEGPAVRWAGRWSDFRLNLYICYPYAAAPHRYESFSRYHLPEQATRLLAHSAYVARDVSAFFHRPARVLPAGTDPNLFIPNPSSRQMMRAKLGIEADCVVLISVASLEPRKGIQHVLQALPALLKHIPRLRYLILGEGYLQPKLEQLAMNLGISDHVIFAGVTDNPVPFYNSADIFVLLSEFEANSVACLEAMACGLPVVVTNSGGFAEVVEPSFGRQVDVHDSKSIVGSIEELARDVGLRRALGNAGRETVMEKYSWSRIADCAIQIFGEELK